MARSFDGTNDDLSVASAVVTTTPFTMACWFKTNGTPGGDRMLMELYDSGVDNANRHGLYVTSDLRVRVITADAAGLSNNINAAAFFTAGAWHHACGVWASATSRRAFLDGINGQSNTTSRTPGALNATGFGAFLDSAPDRYFNGAIMEAAIWNIALSDAEVAILPRGSPLRVRPDGLVAYWPLLGGLSPELDRVGGFHLTVNGATVVDHGRTRYPWKSSNPGFNGTFVVGPGGGRNVFAIPS